MSASTNREEPQIDLLAKAWTPLLQEIDESSSKQNSRICKAAVRTLPLLEDASSVPFVCRYRTEIIDPLTTKQVHHLLELRTKHDSLKSLRNKLLPLVDEMPSDIGLDRILTSVSKSELEDWYAPFKPPSKGSIADRIQQEHPQLVNAVNELWSGGGDVSTKTKVTMSQLRKLGPYADLVHLLSTKVAGHPTILEVVLEEVQKHCRIQTSLTKKATDADKDTYRNYQDFSCPLKYVKDHQVLAIRRGVDTKALKLAFDLDGSKMEGSIRYHLRQQTKGVLANTIPGETWKEVVHDAWGRSLRRKATSRMWTEKCRQAQDRACQVFQDNLHRALLEPPYSSDLSSGAGSSSLLALDPGFKAGIKCAILSGQGDVVRLQSVSFLGKQREAAIQSLGKLLQEADELGGNNQPKTTERQPTLVALGNGHGSQDCRRLLEEASTMSQIPLHIQLVNEAGASVWSVTENAKQEFPKESAASVASVSIGRRLQNPLNELVKIPPRSLGLGMYQHDLSEKELDDKLLITSVDAVATVGVELNSCSPDILRKVPGIAKLADKVIKARPFTSRQDLLKVPGLGPKTYENCAAFCRVDSGKEPLDATLVHPESYDLARWLLQKQKWTVGTKPSGDAIPNRSEYKTTWNDLIQQASQKKGVSTDRVEAVLENLVDSLLQVDPRRMVDAVAGTNQPKGSTSKNGATSTENCKLLPAELSQMEALSTVDLPLRGILGTIRNIADFGAFVDFGAENDGLVHVSKLGNIPLSSLLIGQEIGVDILGVRNGKVSLALFGFQLENTPPRASRPQPKGSRPKGKRSYSSSSSSRPTTSSKKRSTTSSKKRSPTPSNKRRKTTH